MEFKKIESINSGPINQTLNLTGVQFFVCTPGVHKENSSSLSLDWGNGGSVAYTHSRR